MKIYEFPPLYSQWIEENLKELGFSLQNDKELARIILKKSESYQSVDSITDWSSPALKAAYLSYFLPLNYIRTLKVIDEAKRFNFFNDATSLIDFGCGPGTSTKALLSDPDLKFSSCLGIDSRSDVSPYYLDNIATHAKFSFETKIPVHIPENSTLIASYVLNELPTLPSWIFKVQNLLILEPSTKQASFQFQKLRTELIENGFQILAPCPHSLECPLTHSKKDWCHDRVHWNQPQWFEKIEKNLPIKNKTLTFSYLIATKELKVTTPYTRVVGDAQTEKGKTKWMICQNSEREFMSYLKRQGRPPLIYRGDSIILKSEEKKGNEIRFNQDQILIQS